MSTPWYLTWGVVYEFLRVTTHTRVFAEPWSPADAWSFLEAVLAAPTLRVLAETSGHATILAELIAEIPQLRGNLVHDAHMAASAQGSRSRFRLSVPQPCGSAILAVEWPPPGYPRS